MLTNKIYKSFSEEEKIDLINLFAKQLEVNVSKLMNKGKLPKFRQLRRYATKIMNKQENNNE